MFDIITPLKRNNALLIGELKMAKSKVRKTPTGITVVLSCGDVVHLNFEGYRLVDDKMAWVSDWLGLSIDSETVDVVDHMLYEGTTK